MQKPTEPQKQAIIILDCIHRAIACIDIYHADALCFVEQELRFERHHIAESDIRTALCRYINKTIAKAGR